MPLPTFLVIGSQKAATTSTYEVLRRHPEIAMSQVKETNYFIQDDRYEQGTSFYESFFERCSSCAEAIGEASPGYVCHPDGAARIHALLPHAKLILTVRNPIRRAYAQYWDHRRQFNEPLSFEKAVEIALSDEYCPGRRGYFSRGVYIGHIRRFLQYFQREQLLVLVVDDLETDATQFYRRCFRFLGVDPSFTCPEMHAPHNISKIWNNPFHRILLQYPGLAGRVPPRLCACTRIGRQVPFRPPPIHPAVEMKLLKFYRPYNEQLSEFLNRSLPGWNEPERSQS
jgi:hypothetical protein